MSYGHLTSLMRDSIQDVVHDRIVWDLGAGDLGRSRDLVELGSKVVFAVDKADSYPSRWRGRAIHFIQSYYQDLVTPEEELQVVFLGWPSNQPLHGLVRLLEKAKVVIYLGCNTGGSSCGPDDLFRHLVQREVLVHQPHRQNSMTIYGSYSTTPRRLTGEEWVRLNGFPNVTWEEAERLSAESLAPLPLRSSSG